MEIAFLRLFLIFLDLLLETGSLLTFHFTIQRTEEQIK